MYIQTLRLAIVLAAFVIIAPASAQDCGCNQGGAYGSYGSQDNCGRGITQQQAEGLWGGYCTETCAYPGGGSGGCSLGRKLRGGCGGGDGGCNSGAFGYPTGGGCGGGGGCLGKGGCKLRRGGCGASAASSCDTGSCGGGCDTGSCGAGGKLKGLLSGCKLFGGGCCKFKHSAQACGTNGAYFEEAVGYEYGTSGIQSCVSCGDMGDPAMMQQPMMQQPMMQQPMMQQPMMQQPMMQQPMMQQPMMQHSPVQGAPLMMEPVVGTIEGLNSVAPTN